MPLCESFYKEVSVGVHTVNCHIARVLILTLDIGSPASTSTSLSAQFTRHSGFVSFGVLFVTSLRVYLLTIDCEGVEEFGGLLKCAYVAFTGMHSMVLLLLGLGYSIDRELEWQLVGGESGETRTGGICI